MMKKKPEWVGGCVSCQRSCDLAERTEQQMDTVIDWPTHAHTQCTLDTHTHTVCHPSSLLLLITSSLSLWASDASHSASSVIRALLLSARLSVHLSVPQWVSPVSVITCSCGRCHAYISTVCTVAAFGHYCFTSRVDLYYGEVVIYKVMLWITYFNSLSDIKCGQIGSCYHSLYHLQMNINDVQHE